MHRVTRDANRVDFLGLVGDLRRLLALDVSLLELRQETTPVFVRKGRVLLKLSLDHEFLGYCQ